MENEERGLEEKNRETAEFIAASNHYPFVVKTVVIVAIMYIFKAFNWSYFGIVRHMEQMIVSAAIAGAAAYLIYKLSLKKDIEHNIGGTYKRSVYASLILVALFVLPQIPFGWLIHREGADLYFYLTLFGLFDEISVALWACTVSLPLQIYLVRNATGAELWKNDFIALLLILCFSNPLAMSMSRSLIKELIQTYNVPYPYF